MTCLLLVLWGLGGAMPPLVVGDGLAEVLAIDLDAEGKQDVVVLGEQGVQAWRRVGKEWQETAQVRLAGTPVSLAGGDFDGDGKMDVAVADHDSFGVQLLRGDGRGGLGKGAMLRAKRTGAPHVHGLQAADFNRDGRMDLLFVSSGEGEVIPLWQEAGGQFRAGVAVKMGGNAWHAAVGDVDGDGYADVVSCDMGGKTIAIARNDGRGGFERPRQVQVFARPFLARLADLNGDGHLDIYAVHDDYGRFTILRNDGRGQFAQVAGSPIDLGQEAYGAMAYDFNGDGKLDLGGVAGKELLVYEQRGPFEFVRAPRKMSAEAGQILFLQLSQ